MESIPPNDYVYLPVKLYIERALCNGTLDCLAITDEEACILASKSDYNERLYHIEYPDIDNDLSSPILWNQKRWLESRTRIAREKERTEADKLAYNVLRANRNLLMLAMSKQFMMPEEELLDWATRIIVKEQLTVCVALNITLDNMSFVTKEQRNSFGATITIKPRGEFAPKEYWK